MADVDHAVLRMLPAVRRGFGTFNIEMGYLRAAGIGATFVADVDHAVFRVLLAEDGNLAACSIEARNLDAGVM